MSPDDLHRRASDLFADALDQPEGQRRAFLDTTPEADLIVAEARSLLDAHETASDDDLAPLARFDGTGQTVGPWRLGAVLGAGGMGIVYEAERAGEGFVQRAALKLMQPGVGRDFRARFLHERALLASLDHPGIARLLDGGVDASGRPYLAMELVQGEPITAYADARDLDVPARLGLFEEVAEAVAYAHRTLVVHRDLKPDHVLVASGDSGKRDGERGTSQNAPPLPPSPLARPSIKLLDFGVAKLLGDDDPVLTRTGPGPLTPAYAAPEQLLGRAITTATDVYALGVILYELLAGHRPYDLSGLTASQTEQVVCETDPPPPSSVAPDGAARALRGDLDAVVLKALAKEPERRYASAEALADDLRRYLDDLPVRARPATAGYRLGRFVRRNRWGVLAAAATVALVAILSTVYAVRLTDERNRARAEAERAQAVSDFFAQILLTANPLDPTEVETTGLNAPISAVLAEAAARLERDLADQPEARADLHHVIGDTYEVFGMEERRYHFQRLLAIRESLYAAPHPKLAEAIYHMGKGATDYVEQVRLYEQAAEMLRQRPGGVNYPFILLRLGGWHEYAARYNEAERLYRESYAYVRDHFTEGTEGYRYRDNMLAQMASHVAAIRLLHGEVETSGEWLRLAARIGVEPDINRACVLALWHRANGDDQADQAFSRCAEHEQANMARGARSSERSGYIVEFYDATGRPGLADPFRDDVASYTTTRDSLAPILRAYFERQD